MDLPSVEPGLTASVFPPPICIASKADTEDHDAISYTADRMQSYDFASLYTQDTHIVPAMLHLHVIGGDNDGYAYGTVLYKRNLLLTSVYNFVRSADIEAMSAPYPMVTDIINQHILHGVECHHEDVIYLQLAFIELNLGLAVFHITGGTSSFKYYSPVIINGYKGFDVLSYKAMVQASPKLRKGCLYPCVGSAAPLGMVARDNMVVPFYALMTAMLNNADGFTSPAYGIPLTLTQIIRTQPVISINNLRAEVSTYKHRRYILGLDALTPEGSNKTYHALLHAAYAAVVKNTHINTNLSTLEAKTGHVMTTNIRTRIHNQRLSPECIRAVEDLGRDNTIIFSSQVRIGTRPLKLTTTTADYNKLVQHTHPLRNDYRLGCDNPAVTMMAAFPQVEEAAIVIVGDKHNVTYVNEVCKLQPASINAERVMVYWVAPTPPPVQSTVLREKSGVHFKWCPVVSTQGLLTLGELYTAGPAISPVIQVPSSNNVVRGWDMPVSPPSLVSPPPSSLSSPVSSILPALLVPLKREAAAFVPGKKYVDQSYRDKECIVCLDATIDTVVIPCGHMVCCFACAQSVKETTEECPKCRASINLVLKARR